MKIKIFFIGVPAFLIFLGGCTSDEGFTDEKSSKLYTENDHGYSIVIPPEFQGKRFQTTTQEGWNSPTFTSLDKSTQATIFFTTEDCSRELMGASEIKRLKDSPGDWGKVDFWDVETSFIFPSGPVPLCGPSRINSPEAAVYVFCSDIGEKTVLICMSQATEKKEVAVDFFRTFQWNF